MKKIHGYKIGGNHSTAIDATIPLIKKAEKLDSVSKITLNFIKRINKPKRGPNRVKFKLINGGIQAQVRGNTSIQTITIYCKNISQTQKELQKLF